MAQAHLDEARHEAEELCAGLPWLTPTQAEDLTHHYMHRRLAFTRRMLRGTAERAAQLRQEYEARYAELRRGLLRRHVACACAVFVCAGGLSTLLGLLVR
ncbi:hypothetical protein SUDANB176_00512 [Streptomyces sp. enrichment culture]|uniref:hypothetical protein n=1 Tax=Streptomyces sp. enrichment culture TaxID=1795815 RepID=UPI003F54ABDC